MHKIDHEFFLLWLALVLGLIGCQSIPPQSGESLPTTVETERFHFSASDRVIGQIARITVQEGDTLADIARHFGVGFQAIRDANPDIDTWLPRAALHPPRIRAQGRSLTPGSPPGPDNPLGSHALRLAIPSYLIHGTNKPYGLGLRVSHGCIQLYPEDIAALFPHVPVGTQVTIVDQPYLISWRQGELYIQAHAPLHKDARTLPTLRQALLRRLRQIELESKAAIDWQKVNLAIAEARGIPLPVTKASTSWQAHLEQVTELAHPPFWQNHYQPPAAAPGWYLIIDHILSPLTVERLVAILRHQGPPLPARLIHSEGGKQVVIGPLSDRTEAKAIQRSLYPDLGLPIRLLPPSQSAGLLKAFKLQSSPLVSSRKTSP